MKKPSIRVTIPQSMVSEIRQKCTESRLDYDKVVDEIRANVVQSVQDIWIDAFPDERDGRLFTYLKTSPGH